MRSGQALTALLIRALPAPLHHNAIAEDRHLIEMESAAVAQRRDVHRARSGSKRVAATRSASVRRR
jgi:hypothetical protein